MPCGSSFFPFSLLWYVGEQLTCHLIQPINVNKLSPFLNLVSYKHDENLHPNICEQLSAQLLMKSLFFFFFLKIICLFCLCEKRSTTRPVIGLMRPKSGLAAAVVMVRTLSLTDWRLGLRHFGGSLLDCGT